MELRTSFSKAKRVTAAAIIALGVALALVATRPALAGVVAGETAFKNGDFLTAARELQGPAYRGDPLAQYYLGVIYANGLGGDRSLEDGLVWLMCVAKGAGLPPALKQDAKQRRRLLMSRLSSYAMVQAERRAAALCGITTAAPKPQAVTTEIAEARPQAYATEIAEARPRAYATEIAEARPQAYATEIAEARPRAYATEVPMEDLLKYISPPRGVFGTLFFFPGDTMVYGATAVFDGIGFILLRDIFVGMIKLMGDLIFGLLSLIGWVLIGKFVYFFVHPFVHPLGNAISASKPSAAGGSMGDPGQSQA